MFIIGVLVGRGTVSTEFDFTGSQKELAASLKEAARSEHKSSSPTDFNNEMASDPIKELKESNRKKTITPPDTEVKTQQPKNKKPPPPASAVRKKTAAPVKAIKKKPPKATSTKTIKPSIPAEPSAPAKKDTKRESKRRFLQAAAMKNLKEAKRMADNLRKKGFNAYVATAVIPGKGKNHRVRIGPYQNEQKARVALSRLKQAGIQGILLP